MKVTVLAASVAASMALLAAPASAAATGSTTATSSMPNVAYSGLSYGTKVSALNSTATSGMTAPSSVSCTHSGGIRRTNSVAGVTLPLVGEVGAVKTVAQTTETDAWKRTNTQSQVAGVNLLAGAITADAIKSNSSAYAMADDTRAGVNTLTFVNLKIAGQTIPANVPKNTKITVPGVAEVTVNKQSRTLSTSGQYVSRTVGLSVKALADNPLGLPTSTTIDIASTSAAVQDMRGDQLYEGNGFSTRVRAASGAITSSPTASIGVPCLGGVRTSDLAGVNVPLLITSGTTRTVTKGDSDDTRDWSRVSNTTASPSLLGGLITADSITAETLTLRSRSTGRISLVDQSEILGLRIAGRTIADAELKPNSVVEVPGVAKVTIHKQVKGTKGISVTMLRVELLDGVAGLPTGSVIEVGYSRTGLR